MTDQADPLSGLNAQGEFFEHLSTAGIVERDVVEGDGGAAADQRLGLGMILQFVRQQQGCNRFGQAGDVLGHVDQRHRKVARRAQDRKPERADQHDVAGGRRALLPERDDPRQQRDRQYDCHDGVKQPQFFEIAQAAATGVEFPLDGGVEAVVFVAEAAECADQRQVADDVDHLAVHRSRLVGKIIMQRLARRGQTEHRHQHDTRDDDQPR